MERKPIEWTPAIATNILWQDHQHRELLVNLNLLAKALQENQADRLLDGMIAYLEGYTDDHLAIEEDYMALLKYRDIEEHLAAHTIFRENIMRVKSIHVSGKEKLAAMTLCFDLQEWFVNHIKTFDIRLGAFMNSAAQR